MRKGTHKKKWHDEHKFEAERTTIRPEKAEDEIKYCDRHKVWYIVKYPCKACQEEKKDAKATGKGKS